MLSTGNKVLFISQYAGFIGGLEHYIHEVASLLQKNGFRTYSLFVETTRESERFLSAFEKYWNFDQIGEICEKDFDFTTLHKISNPYILSKILEHFTPTLFVHDHDYYCPKGFKYYPYKRTNCLREYSPFFCGICSSMVPPRHMVGGIRSLLKKNFQISKRLFGLATSCKSFVVLSNFMKDNLLKNGIDNEKIHVLHPFLDAQEFDNSEKTPNEIPQIIFVGQQVMSKGTPLFLEAINKLKTPVQAHILGMGARFDDFKNLSISMGLGQKVSFDGWVPNPLPYFSKADVAVFPSLWQEPFGLSGIEAMSCGTPVVGFDVGGVSEWLKDGYNGFLIPEKDTTEMAKAIDALLSDKKLRQAMGENARKSIQKNYSKEKFLEHFIKIA